MTLTMEFWYVAGVLFLVMLVLCVMVVIKLQNEPSLIRRKKTLPLAITAALIFASGFVLCLTQGDANNSSSIIVPYETENYFAYHDSYQEYSSEQASYTIPNYPVINQIFAIYVKDFDAINNHPTDFEIQFTILSELPIEDAVCGEIQMIRNEKGYVYPGDFGGTAIASNDLTRKVALDITRKVDYVDIPLHACQTPQWEVGSWLSSAGFDVNYLIFTVQLTIKTAEMPYALRDTYLSASVSMWAEGELIPDTLYSYVETNEVVPLGDGIEPWVYLVGIMILTLWFISFFIALITRRQYIMDSMVILLSILAAIALFSLIATEFEADWKKTLTDLGFPSGLVSVLAVVIGAAKWSISIGLYLGAVIVGTVLLKKSQSGSEGGSSGGGNTGQAEESSPTPESKAPPPGYGTGTFEEAPSAPSASKESSPGKSSPPAPSKESEAIERKRPAPAEFYGFIKPKKQKKTSNTGEPTEFVFKSRKNH